MKKKKQNTKNTKNTKNIQLGKPVKPKVDLAEAIGKVLNKYVDREFIDIRDNVEVDLQNLFKKKYPEFKYNGYQTSLGMLDDLVVLYEVKK